MQNYKLLFPALFMVCCSLLPLKGQNHTQSPYSRFGIGELAPESFGMQLGMGNLGIGFRQNNTPSLMNPASYTAQDSVSFILHFGGSSRYSRFSSNSLTEKDWTVNLNHIVFSFPIISKRWYSVLGLTPYSSTGYNLIQYGQPDPDLGTTVDYRNEGNGGLNRLVWGHGVQYGNLSVGVNLSWLFGTISHKNSTSFPFDANTLSIISTRELLTKGFHFQAGAQYSHSWGDGNRLTGGLTYEAANKLSVKETMLNTFINSQGYHDTISYFKDRKQSIRLPQAVGIGIFFNHKDQWLAGIDYSYRSWSDADFFFSNDTLSNAGKISFGAQFVPIGQRSVRSRYYQRVAYRFGAYLSDSYFTVRGEKPNNVGVTAGLGLPFRQDRSMFNISYSFETRGTKNKNLVRENLHIVSISLSLYDFWFLKRKWD